MFVQFSTPGSGIDMWYLQVRMSCFYWIMLYREWEDLKSLMKSHGESLGMVVQNYSPYHFEFLEWVADWLWKWKELQEYIKQIRSVVRTPDDLSYLLCLAKNPNEGEVFRKKLSPIYRKVYDQIVHLNCTRTDDDDPAKKHWLEESPDLYDALNAHAKNFLLKCKLVDVLRKCMSPCVKRRPHTLSLRLSDKSVYLLCWCVLYVCNGYPSPVC